LHIVEAGFQLAFVFGGGEEFLLQVTPLLVALVFGGFLGVELRLECAHFLFVAAGGYAGREREGKDEAGLQQRISF